MTGYWNRTERTRAALQGRFLATGDTYVRNPDGTYTYMGRSDDMLKVGGIWVSPIEVEGCILEMDDVVLAAVVGGADAEGLTKPHAFVVPTGGAQRDTLPERVQAHVRERLAPYKYPAGWMCWTTCRSLPPARSSATCSAIRRHPHARVSAWGVSPTRVRQRGGVLLSTG